MAIAACLATLFTFPLAALLALVWRFPLPFVGYESGIDAVVPAVYAVYFYGVWLGGFFIIGVLGAAAGFTAYRRNSTDSAVYWQGLFGLSALAACVPLILLSTLDYLIGPW